MDNFEKVEKIVEKTGVSYEEAKAALEANGYDLLDAVISLEKQGKVKNGSGYYSTDSKKRGLVKADHFGDASQKNDDDGEKSGGFKEFIKTLCEKKFIVSKKNTDVFEIPVIVLIILSIVAFWAAIPLLIIGLFCDFSYRFSGTGKINVDVNDFCNKAKNAVSDIKKDFMNSNGSKNKADDGNGACNMNGNAEGSFDNADPCMNRYNDNQGAPFMNNGNDNQGTPFMNNGNDNQGAPFMNNDVNAGYSSNYSYNNNSGVDAFSNGDMN